MRKVMLTGNQMKRKFFNPSKSYMHHLEMAFLKMKWYRRLEYSALALFGVLIALYLYVVIIVAFGWRP